MFKNISKLENYSSSYIKQFLKGCVVTEKIDAYYISVTVLSKNEIVIKKANRKEVTRVDHILNAMWNIAFLDWNYLRVNNPDWFAANKGVTLYMFYMPVGKPINTDYGFKHGYLFDKAEKNGKTIENFRQVLQTDTLVYPTDKYTIDYTCQLEKKSNKELDALFEQGLGIEELFRQCIDYEKSHIFAVDEPEGFIYKYNNKIFQLLNHYSDAVEAEKSSYEFLLCDFIQYCKNNNYIDLIDKSYVKTICNLFNDYIVNWEKPTNKIQDNIDSSSIENPYTGYRFDIGYEYIPDPITKNLCKNILYKNIFKVLLANLSRGKEYSHCIYMNSKQVDDWNMIIKNIRVRNVYI